jgi:threonine dehydratase
MREISLETVQDAAKHVYHVAVRTPLVRLDLPGIPRPNPTGGGELEVYLKLENLQPIGSFKIRGAYNAVRQLGPAELERGVWTVSAGNAAQGVALAARTAGARCTVLVIETAPRTKLRAIEQLGAAVVKVSYEEAWETVQTGRSDRVSGAFVHPFADPHFISGNGTVGLEIVEDLPDVDVVVAAVGGGGLLSGIAAAVRALRPGAAGGLAAGGARVHVPEEVVVRGRRRRHVGDRQHVAATFRARRLHRRLPRRGRARHA